MTVESADMEQIRSFIAIELPEEIKRKLGKIQSNLKSGGQFGVKWVNPDSIHLTLKFLGDIPLNRTGEITAAIEESVQSTSPFQLKIEKLGAFPNLRRVNVVWVGLGGDIEKLGNLQKKLESNLERLGFPSEKRAFTPHLTLARVNNRVNPDDRRNLGELIDRTDIETRVMSVESVNLMKSQLTRQGAIYSRISVVNLN